MEQLNSCSCKASEGRRKSSSGWKRTKKPRADSAHRSGAESTDTVPAAASSGSGEQPAVVHGQEGAIGAGETGLDWPS